jgi:hypothetical protein
MSGNKCFHLLNGINNGTSKYSIDASKNVELSTTGGVFDSTKPCYHSLSYDNQTVLSFKTDTTDESLKTSTYTIELRVNPIEWPDGPYDDNTLMSFPLSNKCGIEGHHSGFIYYDISAGDRITELSKSDDKITKGKWFHYAVCQEKGVYWIWYNGRLLTQFVATNPYIADFNTINIFRYNGANPVCYGYIDDVKITVGAALYKTSTFLKTLKQY